MAFSITVSMILWQKPLLKEIWKFYFSSWKFYPFFSTEKGHSSPALVIVNIPAAEKKFAIGCHDGSIRQAKLDLSGETPFLKLGDVILEQSENTKR